jgi:hypothetical protein
MQKKDAIKHLFRGGIKLRSNVIFCQLLQLIKKLKKLFYNIHIVGIDPVKGNKIKLLEIF